MIPALVLTAGRGTRLDPLTRLVAKPAVPLAGRTLVERSLDELASQGVRDAVLNLHHRPETITSIVGDGSHLGLRVRYSWEPIILGSAGGPRRALPLIDADRFLIVNGDTLCNVDLGALIRQHGASGADVTMALVPNPSPDQYNGVRLDGGHRITDFVKKGATALDSWHFIGVQVVEARVFEGLPDGVPMETVWGIYMDLLGAQTGGLYGFRVNEPFVDVGTARDYLTAALTLSGNDRGNAIESGAGVESGARLTRSVVWANATVGARAILDDCIVTGVDVPAGFEASSSVLVPAELTRAGDRSTQVGRLAVFPIQ